VPAAIEAVDAELLAAHVGDGEIGMLISPPVESSAGVSVVAGIVAVTGVDAGVAPVASAVNATEPDTVAFPPDVAIETREPAIVKFMPKLLKAKLEPACTGSGLIVPVI
jgi:hypothetical protein